MSEHNGNSDRVVLSDEGFRDMESPAFRSVIHALIEMDLSEVLKPALDTEESSTPQVICLDDLIDHAGPGGLACWNNLMRLALDIPEFPLRDNPDLPGTLVGSIDAALNWFNDRRPKSRTEKVLIKIAESRRNFTPKE